MTRFESDAGYPHTLPHMGRGADFKSSFARKGFVTFCLRVPSPTSVGFSAHAAVGLRAAKRPCSPKTSLIAHANNGYTRGRVGIFCENKFTPAVKRNVFVSLYIHDEIVFANVAIKTLGLRAKEHDSL